MTLFSQAPLEASDGANVVLAILSEAAEGRNVSAAHRVVASSDSYNADEGLALLDAYVSIADVSVRQAVLDIVLAIAGTNPYRRARSSITTAKSKP